MQTDYGMMLVRLCYSGPLLYIGLSMALDPAGFVAGLANLQQGLRNFEQHLQGLRGQPPLGQAQPPAVSRAVRAVFRMGGAVLAVISLLHLIGVIS